MSDPVRVRIAPSPSGHLHVGTARTAVYNWLYARRHGGTFILRIEDTDRERSFNEYTRSIQNSLRWLGLDWDEGPYFQSQRTDLYRDWVARLCDSGHVYECWATADELEPVRQDAQKQGHAPRFRAISETLTDEEKQRRLAAGIKPAWRLAIPDGPVRFDDVVYGTQERAGTDIDEFVVARGDGTPTYNFACVIDDSDMSISHVIRGNDHITNTFKQVLLYDALRMVRPVFAHLPLGLGSDRRKISKREGATSITEYRDAGYLPEALLNFLALLGWSPGDDREILAREEMVELFSLERINASNPVFDLQKLEWMNAEYIRALDEADLLQRAQPFLVSAGLIGDAYDRQRLQSIIRVLRERMRRLTDVVEQGRFFFDANFEYDTEGVRKQFERPGVDGNLNLLRYRWEMIGPDRFNAETTEAALRALAEELGHEPADLIHPLRLALSGRTGGPGLFEIAAILGRDECLRRITRAIDYIRGGRAGAP